MPNFSAMRTKSVNDPASSPAFMRAEKKGLHAPHLVLVNFDPLRQHRSFLRIARSGMSWVLIATTPTASFEWLQQFLALDDYFVIVVQIEERAYCVE
jgi:hypothetical protein